MRRYLLVFVLCSISYQGWSRDRLTVDQFLIYADLQNLTFEELYTKEQSDQISFTALKGLSTDINYYWIKLDGDVLSTNQYLFLSNYFERIEGYYPGDSQPSSLSGRFVDLDQRSYQKGFYRNVIPLQDRSDPLYIKLTSITGFSLFNRSLSQVETATAEDLNIQSQQIFTSFTLLIGMEFIILLINIVLLVLRPSYTAFFYSLLILTGILLANFQNQVTIDIIPIGAMTLHYTEMFLGMAIAYSFGAFSSYYLRGNDTNRLVHYVMVLPYFPLILLFGFIGTGPYHPPAATAHFLLVLLSIGYLLINNWGKQKRRSIIFTLANFLPVFTAMAMLLALNGLLEHSFLTTNAVYLGFMLRDSIFTIDLIRDYFNLQTDSIRSEMQIEKLNEEKEQLQRIEELKTQFFNNASHELRTPLTLILSPLEKSIKSGKIPPELQSELNLSLKNGKYLLQLVNEMLDLAKLDKGELKLLRQSTDVAAIINKIRDSFQSYAQEREQIIYLALARESIIAEVDPDKFEKIMINLISNAIKYSNKPGKVMISIEENNDLLKIEVADEGVGIPQKELPNIFDRYYQASSTKAEDGTGIGLSIVKEFVELHTGEVSCQSVLGKGSTFRLEFPNAIITSKHAKRDSISQKSFDPSKATLLIVEDHPDLRGYLKDQFPGYNVREASNGETGLELLKEGLVPDLILTDYVMPKLNGYEMAEQIKQHLDWRNIPIMFLTARTLSEDRIKVLNLGVDDYITKPFDLEELQVRIQNMLSASLERKTYISQELPDTQIEEEDSFKKQLDDFLLDQIGNSALSNADIAYHFSISERNLYRRIKLATGQSPAHYLREIRLQKARSILETNTDTSVGDAARACGIDNLAYFSQTFKKRFGKSPSEVTTSSVLPNQE